MNTLTAVIFGSSMWALGSVTTYFVVRTLDLSRRSEGDGAP